MWRADLPAVVYSLVCPANFPILYSTLNISYLLSCEGVVRGSISDCIIRLAYRKTIRRIDKDEGIFLCISYTVRISLKRKDL